MKHILSKLSHQKIGLFPHDTVWGFIGAMHEDVAKKLIKIKNREASKGFIVLIPENYPIYHLCDPVSVHIQNLLDQYWPGPVTFILPKSKNISPFITGSHHSIAIRMPGKSPIQSLLNLHNAPLLSTSANLSSEPIFQSKETIPNTILKHCDFIEPMPSEQTNQASTIISCLKWPPTCLRQGSIQIDLPT